LNPSLLNNLAPAGYELHVPKGNGDHTLAALQSVPRANRNAWRLHHVAAGETLDAIARQYHLQPERIQAVNNSGDSLDAGETLFIPAVYHQPAPAKSRTRIRSTKAASARSTKSQSTSKASAQRVSQSTLHRRAAVRTASLNH
jgi:membrane-bound lytic murein transglycosylase D